MAEQENKLETCLGLAEALNPDDLSGYIETASSTFQEIAEADDDEREEKEDDFYLAMDELQAELKPYAELYQKIREAL